MYDLIVVGGGAAGFFAALAAKEAKPEASVLILEKSAVLLSKVRISGGGRCNVTHACFDPLLFCKHYPRGEKELLGPFNRFQAKDTIEWFESRGVILKAEEDGRIFPITDSSETVIQALLEEAKKLGVEIRLREKIEIVEKQEEGFIPKPVENFTFDNASATDLQQAELVSKQPMCKHMGDADSCKDGDAGAVKSEVFNRFRYTLHTKNGEAYRCKKLILATGSSPEGYSWASSLGHTIQPPVPSLFTFNVPGSPLQELSGVSFDEVEIKIQGTDHRQTGPLLITHFGFSGPAALKLSAWAARYLHEKAYAVTLLLNWVPAQSVKETERVLEQLKARAPNKTLVAENPFHLPKSFWKLFVKEEKRLNDYSLKELHLLAERVHADPYQTHGKTTHKEEFVTCGGVTLKEIHFKTMESRICPGLHFAGEILDIDGVTGGFNFQNAWTTGFLAGTSAANSLR